MARKANYVNKFTLKEICEIIDVELPAAYADLADVVFTNVAYRPDFIQKDGAYILNATSLEEAEKRLDKAIREKVKFIFVNKKYVEDLKLDGIPHIVIEKPFGQVIKLSASIRKKLKMKVVGITESLGKTTTKDVVFSVLNYKHKAKKSIGNQNAIFPIFDNMQRMPKDNEFFVQEFGAASPNVMPRTVGACIPDVGIITNISDPHLDVFGTKENIMAEKLRMIKKMPAGCPAFLNYDDPLLKTVELEKHPIISFAVVNKDADYHAENIEEDETCITFDMVKKVIVERLLFTRMADTT